MGRGIGRGGGGRGDRHGRTNGLVWVVALLGAVLGGFTPTGAAGASEVNMMNSDELEATDVPSHAAGGDGNKIAFTSRRTGDLEILVTNVDGSGLTNLTRHPGGDYGPAWSPDGTKIAFGYGADIFVMNPDGTGVIFSPTTRCSTSARSGRPTEPKSHSSGAINAMATST